MSLDLALAAISTAPNFNALARVMRLVNADLDRYGDEGTPRLSAAYQRRLRELRDGVDLSAAAAHCPDCGDHDERPGLAADDVPCPPDNEPDNGQPEGLDNVQGRPDLIPIADLARVALAPGETLLLVAGEGVRTPGQLHDLMAVIQERYIDVWHPGAHVLVLPPGTDVAGVLTAAEDAADLAAAQRAMAAPGPCIPAEQVWRELGIDDEQEA